MKIKRNTYRLSQKASAIFMIMALVWLTISTPFVCAFQQQMAEISKIEKKHSPLTGNEEESSNTLGSNTEEKTPGGNPSFSEEYLHDHYPSTNYFIYKIAKFYNCKNSKTYIAFHGELIVPPPNAA